MGIAAAAPLILAGASGLVKAGGEIYGGMTKAAAYRYQSQVAANNAKIAEQNAGAALFAGQGAESALRVKTTKLIGEQTAAQAASGIDVGTGSALGLREQTREMGDLDALTIRYNAAREAYGYKTQAMGYQAESAADRAAATSAQTGGFLEGVGSLIGTASSIANQRASMKLAGMGR